MVCRVQQHIYDASMVWITIGLNNGLWPAWHQAINSTCDDFIEANFKYLKYNLYFKMMSYVSIGIFADLSLYSKVLEIMCHDAWCHHFKFIDNIYLSICWIDMLEKSDDLFLWDVMPCPIVYSYLFMINFLKMVIVNHIMFMFLFSSVLQLVYLCLPLFFQPLVTLVLTQAAAYPCLSTCFMVLLLIIYGIEEKKCKVLLPSGFLRYILIINHVFDLNSGHHQWIHINVWCICAAE